MKSSCSHAGLAVTALRQGIDSVANGAADGGPPIRVGALPTVSAHIMPRAMSLFLQENTGSSIKIVTGENAVLLEQLRLGELDVVVGRLAAPDKMTGFFFEHLYSEQVVFVVRAGHPLLGVRRDVFERLGDFPVLMPTRGSIIRPYVERLFITNGVAAIPTEIETVSDSFGRAFVRQSDAVWIISAGVVADEIAGGTLIALPVDTTTPGVPSASPCAPTRLPSPAFFDPAADDTGGSGRRRRGGGRKRSERLVRFSPEELVFSDLVQGVSDGAVLGASCS